MLVRNISNLNENEKNHRYEEENSRKYGEPLPAFSRFLKVGSRVHLHIRVSGRDGRPARLDHGGGLRTLRLKRLWRAANRCIIDGTSHCEESADDDWASRADKGKEVVELPFVMKGPRAINECNNESQMER